MRVGVAATASLFGIINSILLVGWLIVMFGRKLLKLLPTYLPIYDTLKYADIWYYVLILPTMEITFSPQLFFDGAPDGFV